MAIEQLENAMHYGDLGIQYCIKSELAFNRLKEVYRDSVSLEYHKKFNERDLKARQNYFNARNFTNLHETSLETILRREGL